MAAIGIFVVGSILDIVTTVAIVNTPGVREANPIVAATLSLGGPLLFAALKLSLGVFAYLAFRDPTSNRQLIAAFTGLGGLWFLAGLWNIYVLLART
jgi:uncharacterized membrane protein YqgA involved in biofilm formation